MEWCSHMASETRTLDVGRIEALCFDLGNTLIEFGPRQIAHQYEALKGALLELYGHCDEKRLKEVRDRQLMAPYHNGYRENGLWSVCAELIREVYGEDPEDGQVQVVTEARHRAFVEVVEVDGEVLSLLEKLGARYRLGLLSNYPCGRSVRDGLERLGLAEVFETVVVSGDVGFVKPHAKPYELLLEGMAVEGQAGAYVGDNWLADVQGAKGIGMQAIYLTQHLPYETFAPQEGDAEPDARIAHFGELEGLLLG